MDHFQRFSPEEVMMKKSWSFFTVILVLLVSTGPAVGLQMITNGNFETGDLTGWNIGGDFPILGAFAVPSIWPAHPELDCWVASVAPPFLGPIQAVGTSFLFQSFVIPLGTPAATVAFQYMPWSFDAIEYDFVWIGMQHDYGFDLYEYWGGQDFGCLETPGWQSFYHSYDLSGISSPINCTIAFGVTTSGDICYPTGLFVDNVSVEAVPEPATLLLLGGGLVGMGLFGTFRRKKR
jgi:hypothetical protein